MQIRRAKLSDLPRLAEMYFDLFRHVKVSKVNNIDAMKRYANKKHHQKGHFIFVAEDKGFLIGSLTVRMISKKRGHLLDAYVEPSHRRGGVMKALEGRVTQFLRKRGATTVTLEVQSSNQEGVETWPALGYKVYEYSMKKEIT
jgi:ribosomal protein S18 acetylase RimI-like enzyme